MWLVERDTDGTGPKQIPLPGIVRDALVRWYTGEGGHEDEDVGITLVQQARIGARWIACDCLPTGERPPILTPAYLSEAETYYLRRLTSATRPEHHAHCPFFRDQVTHRITEVRRPDMPADPPSGYFEVLKPAPEKLAQRPDEDASDDRTRQASVPRLARLLWRLLSIARANCCPPLSFERVHGRRSISRQFQILSEAATRIEVAPGIELGRVLWTHAAALRSRRAYAALRAIAGQWPPGHAPQGFLLLYATAVRGQDIYLSEGEPVRVANRVQSPASRDNPVDGPFLVLVVLGQYPEALGYAPLRAYAQPIYSGHRFVPVDRMFERRALTALLSAQREFERAGIELAVEKQVFDRLTPSGSCRPEFVVEARSRLTGEVKQIAIQIIERDDPVYLAARTTALAPLGGQMQVHRLTATDVRNGQVALSLAKALAI